jgi:flavin-dependent dehydrogenase
MLLDHARDSGVCVYERTKVTSLRFSDQSRPVSAEWRRSYPTDHSGEISFDFLVDATGRAGLMSDRYMKNRHYNESLRNIAHWGYWSGVGTYGLGTEREGAPWFEALTGEYRRSTVPEDL